MTTSKDYLSIITEIYRKYNPEKIKDIPFLLEKYAAREEELLESIITKYELTETDAFWQKDQDLNATGNLSQFEEASSMKSGLSWSTILAFAVLTISIIVCLYAFLNNRNTNNISSEAENSVDSEIRDLTTSFIKYSNVEKSLGFTVVAKHYSEISNDESEATITMQTKENDSEKRQTGYVYLRFRKIDGEWGIVQAAFPFSGDHTKDYHTFPEPITLKNIKLLIQKE